MIKSLAFAAGLVSVVASAQPAAAQTFQTTVGEFNGPGNVNTFPTAFNVANFNLSGMQFFSMTLSGTFGNSSVPNSSGLDIFFGNILVAQCFQNATCWTSQTPTAWSYTFTAADLASFNSLIQGQNAFLVASQTSPFVVRLGQTNISGRYGPFTPVPEPATVGLLATGLVALGAFNYRRRKKAD